jgi:basic amino acid/polyamine antiporter, APA family
VTVTPEPKTGVLEYGNLYNNLLTYTIPVDLAFYALMVGAVAALRLKAPELSRPYRAIGYPFTVILYIGLALLLVVDFVYLKPAISGAGFLIVFAGIPVYMVWSRLAGRLPRVAETVAT